MTVADVLAALEARDPTAMRLAEVASLAVEIQPALLRRLRRRLVPDSAPLAEAILWSSDLVSSRTASAMLLRDDVLLALRERLRQDQDRLDAAHDIVAYDHRGIAEVLRCEEDLVYFGLVDLARKPRPDLDEAELEKRIRQRLEQVIQSIRKDADRRDSLLAWSARALPTLPDRVQTHDHGVWLGKFVVAGGPVTEQAWRDMFPPSDQDVGIGVRWTSKGIELSAAKDRDPVLRLPPMSPLLVDVEAETGDDWAPLSRAVVPPHGAVTVAVGAAITRLRLRSLRGDGVILRQEGRGGAGRPEIAIARLPVTGSQIFGREEELGWLDACWRDGVHVATIVAWGGVGKSALVNAWLAKLRDEAWGGAKRVFGWSFYSQGTDRLSSSDEFIDVALRWFGDADPKMGSPWDKGEQLAALVRKQKTILVLDGVEPLQWGPGMEQGKLKDPALQALVKELGAQNMGLCLITTRIEVTDLEAWRGDKVTEHRLDHLSVEAGAELLEARGAKGTKEELQAAAKEYDGHSFALTLLGSYVRTAHKGDIRQREDIPPLEGKPAHRMMARYEKWFENKPALAILRMLGLFDRPAPEDEIAAVRAPPVIIGLTDALDGLTVGAWNQAVTALRDVGLLAGSGMEEGDRLDAHPLVREYFGEQLKREQPEAWREGHRQLYEHLKGKAKELPDSIEEMAPLYAAMVHGCQAGKNQEVCAEVLVRRIRRGKDSFSVRKLGALGSEVAALSAFFDPPWERLAPGLGKPAQAWVLNETGFVLRALGRLPEAAGLLRLGLEQHIAQRDWQKAAIAASTLGGLLQAQGELRGALEQARKSVEFADESGDAAVRVSSRTVMAEFLHAIGLQKEASLQFHQAERMQQERQPHYPLLYSLGGFLYCDHLLDRGQYAEVRERAAQTLEWVRPHQILADIAFDNLSLGRAHLLAIQRGAGGDLAQAASYIKQAVDGLRLAAYQEHLPRGLLARAALHTQNRAFDLARRDLDDVLNFATRCDFRLFEADAHLGHARLCIAEGAREQAREHVATARAIVEATGYHRRNGELAELGRLAEIDRALDLVDFLLLTTLEEECSALLNKLPGFRKIDAEGTDDHVYFAAEVPTRRQDKTVYRIVVMRVAGIGPIQAAISASAAASRWHPEHVLVIGIAGGVGDEVGLGDVIVGSQVADSTVGKVHADGRRKVDWKLYPADPELFDAVKALGTGWEDLIVQRRPSEGKPKRHVGVISSGGDVIASKDLIATYRADFPGLIGVEMEGAGVAAALHSQKIPPRFLMIRGVADLAGGEDMGGMKRPWRAYACDVAAAYTIALLRDVYGQEPLEAFAVKYENLRKTLQGGPERTRLMNELLAAAKREAAALGVKADQISHIYASGREGRRVVALACCAGVPAEAPVGVVADALRSPRTPFEQWAALLATAAVVSSSAAPRAEPFVRAMLTALDDPRNLINDRKDTSRHRLASTILRDAAARIGFQGSELINALLLWLSAGEPPTWDRRPCVAVFGSSGSPDHAGLCQALGERLAGHGWRLSIGRGYNVGPEVLAGFRRREPMAATVYTTSSVDGDPAITKAFPALDEARRQMVASADCALAIAGSRGTRAECELAMDAGLPVLAVSFTGGAAREMTTRTREAMGSLGVPSPVLGLMDESPGLPEEAAERIVRVLDIVMRHSATRNAERSP